MSSNVLKCKSCNIVINELLSFVQNKVNVMDDESLVRVCTTAFSETDIAQAKSLLFDSVSKRKKTRRREGKTLRDLDDIICLIRETATEDIPIFVARELDRLPPVTFDHVDVTRLLKDIILIQKELRDIQEKYASEVEYATVEQLNQLKFEIDNLKKPSIESNCAPYVNMRRGAFRMHDSYECNSGPMGLEPCANRSTTLDEDGTKATCQSAGLRSPSLSYAGVLTQPPLSPPLTASIAKNFERVEAPAAGTAVTNSDVVQAHTSNEASTPLQPVEKSANFERACGNISTNKGNNEMGDEEGWTLVQRREKASRESRERFIGKKGKAIDSNSKFKAAVINIPLFIYNVSKETTANDISEYIKDKTQISVSPEKVSMKNSKMYDSYKIMIPKHKLSLFDNDSLWPDGIFFRKYIIFRKRTIPDNENKNVSK